MTVVGQEQDQGRAGRAGPARGQGAILLAGSCLPILGSVLLAPVLPRMIDAFATTPGVDVLVPIVLTAPALVIGLLAPVAGRLVDAAGRKRVLVANSNGLLADDEVVRVLLRISAVADGDTGQQTGSMSLGHTIGFELFGEIDLDELTVDYAGGVVEFEVEEEIRHRLLNGHDEIAITLQRSEAIDAYERDREVGAPDTTAL